MRLETERLILRPFEPRDHAPYAAINADPEVMRYFHAPFTREETEASIARAHENLERNGFHFLATELRETGELIGILGMARIDEATRAAIPSRPEVEIGWRLRRDTWGKGLAPEGARAWLDYAWNELRLPEVVALTYKGNLPSQRVMEKIGMVYVPEDDFIHPRVPADSPVRESVLYRIVNPSV